MPALVTIGIPCFNSAPWLAQAIESALAQTWSDLEVIVVDDGSTDRSAEIARDFGQRILFLTGENRGANHARNQVLKHARGEWLQYLDADDYLEPEKIARQFSETENGETADVLYSPVWWETWRGGRAVERVESKIDVRRDLFTQWLTWEMPQTGGFLWRQTALQALGGWREGQPCCQDNELYLRAIQAGLRFAFARTPHAVYRLWSEETLCHKDPRRVIEVKTKLMESLRLWMKERGCWSSAHQSVAARACFEMCRTLAKTDLQFAAKYHAARRGDELLELSGPAAPLSYRIAYRLLGFAHAERLARRFR